ncbi:MAG: CNNM domain-containing protein [Bacteroidales bacterium]|jgi:CBS domain containing-hemolysin-like protein|nr:CNNM domain-containing protein [Bacteroidales bacterium]
MGLLLTYLFVALFFSFLCSILEAVLLSITPSYIASKAKENKRYAIKLQKYKENIDLPLAAILTINTFAHTIGAAGVGGQVQVLWGNELVSIASAILTIIILIFSEIIPKTLGANYWKQLAPFASTTLTIMIYSPLYPVIWLSKLITVLLSSKKTESVLSRSEFHAMAEIGVKEGIFKEEESKILMNLMVLNHIVVKSIMTPRTVVLAAPEDITIQNFFSDNEVIRFSRIPVFKENIDNITGYVLKDDIMQGMIDKKEQLLLLHIRRDIKVVNEKMPIIRLFYKLIEEKEHIAMVVGEYGEMVGIVTMEDIIETLLGTEIMDELDNVEDMQEQAKKMWEKRAKRLGII